MTVADCGLRGRPASSSLFTVLFLFLSSPLFIVNVEACIGTAPVGGYGYSAQQVAAQQAAAAQQASQQAALANYWARQQAAQQQIIQQQWIQAQQVQQAQLAQQAQQAQLIQQAQQAQFAQQAEQAQLIQQAQITQARAQFALNQPQAPQLQTVQAAPEGQAVSLQSAAVPAPDTSSFAAGPDPAAASASAPASASAQTSAAASPAASPGTAQSSQSTGQTNQNNNNANGAQNPGTGDNGGNGGDDGAKGGGGGKGGANPWDYIDYLFPDDEFLGDDSPDELTQTDQNNQNGDQPAQDENGNQDYDNNDQNQQNRQRHRENCQPLEEGEVTFFIPFEVRATDVYGELPANNGSCLCDNGSQFNYEASRTDFPQITTNMEKLNSPISSLYCTNNSALCVEDIFGRHWKPTRTDNMITILPATYCHAEKECGVYMLFTASRPAESMAESDLEANGSQMRMSDMYREDRFLAFADYVYLPIRGISCNSCIDLDYCRTTETTERTETTHIDDGNDVSQTISVPTN